MNFWFISHNFLLSLSNCNALWSNVSHFTEQVQVYARIDNLSVKFYGSIAQYNIVRFFFWTFMCNIPSMQFIVRDTDETGNYFFHHRYTFDSVEPSRMKRKKNGSFKMRGKKSIYRIIMKLFLDNDHWEFRQQQQRSARLHETFWMFSVCTAVFFYVYHASIEREPALVRWQHCYL